MFNKVFIGLILCAQACSLGSAAQTYPYKLRILGARDGLLSSKTFCLLQAKDRTLWIGTEFGAASYDGYNFTNYQYSTDNEPIGRILSLATDNQQGMWLGGDKGLFYLQNNRISKIATTGAPPLAIEALHTDAQGNVWIGDMNALYKLSAATIVSLKNKKEIKLMLLPFAAFKARVFDIDSDEKQQLYVASFDGVYQFVPGVSRFNQLWKNPMPANHVRSVTAASPDSIFWSCMNGDFIQKTGGSTKERASRNYLTLKVFKNEQQAFALTTAGVGHIKDSITTALTFGSSVNNVISALVDEENNIWVASWEGLLKFTKSSFTQHRLQEAMSQEVFSFLERQNGELLFGSNRGRVFTKRNKGIELHPAIPAMFANAEVLCLHETANGTLWAGSGYEGISKFANGQLHRYVQGAVLKDNNCEALYALPNGKMYACTEQGVALLNPDLPEPVLAQYSFREKFTRDPELFGCFSLSDSAYLFYGSQGIFRLKDAELVSEAIAGMPVKNLYITKMLSDRPGHIWVATIGKGVLQCSMVNGKLTLLKIYNQNTPPASDIALSILVDKHNNVWWADYANLFLMSEGKQLMSFGESDGLLASYYQTLKLEQQKDGTIWGLTSMGMFSFSPDSILKNELPPTLHLNRVNGTDTSANFISTANPGFAYNDNSLQFHYTAISLTNPGAIRYAHRLLGFDSSWTYSSSRVTTYRFLPPGQYQFQLKAANNNNIWTTSQTEFAFEIAAPFWQRWWFRLLLAVTIIGTVLLLFWSRIKVIKQKARIKQQMAGLEAKAIRAQMNPHFIFNSLNAIQESIVLNDYDTAYQYLSKFSKLLRLVLNNSDKNFIALTSEIEMNRLYLELESLRFKNSFSYSIEVDDALDTEDIEFPSLLVQPFIENAVWHGLMQKEGSKKLLLHFYAEGQQLHCIIEDNGIGRQKAGEIKEKKLGAHHFESKGSVLAMQRIQLLKETCGMETKLTIEDLHDEGKVPAGTRIHMVIPLMK